MQPDALQTILFALHEEGLPRLQVTGEEVEWTRTAYDMAGHLKLIAKRWVKVDIEKLAELEKLVACITLPRRDLSERMQSQFAEFRTDEERKELYSFAGEAFRLASDMLRDRDTRRDAKLHETALALMIVLRHVPRRADLAGFDIERHLTHDRGGGITEFAVRTRKVTGVVLRAEIAPDLAERLDRHIRVSRPCIPWDQGSTALFPAPKGGTRCPSTRADRSRAKRSRKLMSGAWRIKERNSADTKLPEPAALETPPHHFQMSPRGWRAAGP